MPSKKKNTKNAANPPAKKRPRLLSSPLNTTEPDSVYFLKIVLYVMLGTLWVKFGEPLRFGDLVLHALPLGLILGVIVVNHDRFQVDRKIGYAILVVVTVMSYFLPAGIIV